MTRGAMKPIILICFACLCLSSLGQQDPKPWLAKLLSEKGVRQEFSVRGRRALYVAKELTDPTNSRVGLKLVFFEVSPSDYDLSVFRVGPEGTAASIATNSTPDTGAIVVVNGGYYGTDDNKTFYPLGLLIHKGRQLNKTTPWTSGGVLYTTAGPPQIIRIRGFQRSSDIVEALQSKPLLVEDSMSGIHSDDHQMANRTAIGIRRDGTIVVAGAFSPSNNALTLTEFAEFLRGPLAQGGAGVEVALNMDGGPSSLIICPPLNLTFGQNLGTFIPDGIRISARR